MEVNVRPLKRVQLVELSGRIDHQNAPLLEQKLSELVDAGNFRLVIDMSGVEYISSAGLRVLLGIRKKVRRWNRGDLRLAALKPTIKDTFELVGFTRIFDIYDDVIEAVGSF
jgi:anti-sigma B factor antagonist